MIAEFEVQNFYSIRSRQTLSFVPTPDVQLREEYCHEVKKGVSLLKIGIIYGSNASGKTNVLNAISFFRELMLDTPKKSDKIGVVPFMLDDESRKDPTWMKMSFYIGELKYVLEIKFDNDRIYDESLLVYRSFQPSQLYKRVYVPETDSTSITFGNKLGLLKKDQTILLGNAVNNCSVIATFGVSNIAKSALNEVYDFFLRHMADPLRPHASMSAYTQKNLKNDGDGTIKKFLLMFLKASDFNIEDIDVRDNEIEMTPEMDKMLDSMPMPKEARDELRQKGKITTHELLFKHKTDSGIYELPEDVESRGTTRFMGMAIILKKLLLDNCFVSIDEVETSIHYELLSYFIRVFLANSENNSQLLLTTHDINLLNEDYIRRDAIWFTDKDTEGETQLVRLSSLGLHKNLSPYNAYRQGKLVKLPFLGSQYLELNEVNNG